MNLIKKRKNIEKHLTKAYELATKYCCQNEKTKKFKSSLVDAFLNLRDLEPYQFNGAEK